MERLWAERFVGQNFFPCGNDTNFSLKEQGTLERKLLLIFAGFYWCKKEKGQFLKSAILKNCPKSSLEGYMVKYEHPSEANLVPLALWQSGLQEHQSETSGYFSWPESSA